MTRFEDDSDRDMIDGILQPNGHFRVPVFLRDGAPNPSLTPVQRAIAVTGQHDAATFDAATFDAASHRSGHRYAIDAAPLNDAQRLRYGVFDGAKEKAYSDSDRDLANSWRGNTGAAPPAGSYPEGTSHEGRACTVDGAPGTLRAIPGHDGWLQCVADTNDSRSDAQQIKDSAYSEYELRIQNSWRTAS
jgi:hypothetical protein